MIIKNTKKLLKSPIYFILSWFSKFKLYSNANSKSKSDICSKSLLNLRLGLSHFLAAEKNLKSKLTLKLKKIFRGQFFL